MEITNHAILKSCHAQRCRFIAVVYKECMLQEATMTTAVLLFLTLSLVVDILWSAIGGDPALTLLGSVVTIAILVVVMCAAPKYYRPIQWTVLIGVLLIGSIGLLHWPLWLRFRLARAQFTSLVEQFNRTGASAIPLYAGSFKVMNLSRRHHSLFFVTDDHPKGASGILFAPKRDVACDFNCWSIVHLGQSWYYIVED